jgi:C-lobe and N-lobe beta barrels of Tf-binding protein B
MKTSLKLLPYVIALCLVGGAQTVSASTDCVETGGSGDSVNEWGIWCGVGSFLQAITEADAPAAGPGVDAGDVDTRDVGRSDSGTFDPNVNTPTPDPEPEAPAPLELHIQLPDTEEGEYVGYFSTVTNEKSFDPKEKNGQPKKNKWKKTSDEQTYNGVGSVKLGLRDDGKKNDSVDITFTSPSGEDSLPGSIEGRSKDDPSTPEGLTYSTVVKLGDESTAGKVVAKSEMIDQDGNGKNRNFAKVVLNEGDPISDQLLKDYWSGRLDLDSSQKEYWTSFDKQSSDFNMVAGILTPLNDITSMISGDVTANYRGASAAFGQSVDIAVDFGSESFSATVGGVSGDIQTQYNLSNDMGFSAAGVIQGQHLISTSVSADSGYMQGSFFGPDADVVGGAYEVTKGADTVGDVFTATKNTLR